MDWGWIEQWTVLSVCSCLRRWPKTEGDTAWSWMKVPCWSRVSLDTGHCHPDNCYLFEEHLKEYAAYLMAFTLSTWLQTPKGIDEKPRSKDKGHGFKWRDELSPPKNKALIEGGEQRLRKYSCPSPAHKLGNPATPYIFQMFGFR